MTRLRRRALIALPLAFVAAVLVPLSAQNAAKKPIALGDILSFRAMTTTALSPDGRWFAYRVSPLEGDSDVIVRHTSSGQEYTFPVGEGAGPMTFSDDSQWFALATSLTREEAAAARRARRPVQTRWNRERVSPTHLREGCLSPSMLMRSITPAAVNSKT